MAQTETPDELRQPKAKTKKTQSTPDELRSRSSAAQQNGKGRGGIAKKETAKPTCRSSPNYMKPTTCSDARKEPLQVSAQSPAPATVVKAKNHADQSNSKPSPSPSLPVAKYSKTLARKASLRPRRPSMKKIYETSVLSPRRKVSRATCSSTMKESKSPNVSEVNPGNEVAELTSVVKVCPFNYCSLHGRRHQHLQPSRRLPSARRSFRTQRSVKLKRVSSIRKRSFKKGGRSMNSGKTKSAQETDCDISNDLSAESKKDLRFGRRIHEDEFDREISKFLESLESSEDDTEFSEEEIEEFGGAGTQEKALLSACTIAESSIASQEEISERNRSVVADDQGSESSDVSDCKKSEADDNSNISNGGEDDRIEDRNAEQSILAAAEEWPENKEPEINSGYENPDCRLKLTEEEKVRGDRFIEYQGFWDSSFIDLSEDIYSENDQSSENDQKEHTDGDIFATICTRNGMITSSEEAARCNQSPKLSHKQKARRRSLKWKKDIEMEMLRLIDPRAPRFLPVEPDPADETVDLRHQQTDERKSSETWMIDDALQKAVRKLTPARSKKVALLVEAFEAVMAVPIHDLTLKSPTSDLARPVQACR